MDRMARTDWKRHSAPYDLTFDLSTYKMSVDEMFDEAMAAFTSGGTLKRPNTHAHLQTATGNAQPQRTSTMVRDRKKSVGAVNVAETELSTDRFTPGVLKIFGETILPGVQYKSVLASCRSTAQELVKQALERFGLPASNFRHYVLCDVVGRYDSSGTDGNQNEERFEKWERLFSRALSEKDKPLLLQKFWKPIEGYSRRYELREKASASEIEDDDDTIGLNENARKILISKLRPGAIPLFNASTLGRSSDKLKMDATNCSSVHNAQFQEMDCDRLKNGKNKTCSSEMDTKFPEKHPFFLTIRGFDVKRDKMVYVIKSKRFNFVNPNLKARKTKDDVPKYGLYAPDISSVHCCFKVYKFKRSNGVSDVMNERYNYFLELTPTTSNVSVNGRNVRHKVLIKSGDILNIGIYYMFLFKDCSKGFDIPLSLPWITVPEINGVGENVTHTSDVNNVTDDVDDTTSATGTDDSTEMSISERMSLSYHKDKEEDLMKYICAIIQQQNTSQTYPLTSAFLFAMAIEHASRKFDARHLKHMFLRILFSIRENVAVS